MRFIPLSKFQYFDKGYKAIENEKTIYFKKIRDRKQQPRQKIEKVIAQCAHTSLLRTLPIAFFLFNGKILKQVKTTTLIN